MEELYRIHDKVFNYLIEIHKENEDFLFGMRQINRGGRLDKGYWFVGDDWYLAVPFWRGRDWVTKMPYISFVIGSEGKTWLEFSSKSISDKMDYFESALIQAVGAETLSSELQRKYYREYQTDYLASLKNFLITDKPLIDRYVVTGKAINPAALEYIDELGMIWPAEFEKQVSNIKKYKTKIEQKKRTTGFLRSFSIKNYQPIHHLEVKEIPAGCRWIFITGENGAGKTTVLKALATALCQNNDTGVHIGDTFGDFSIQVEIDGPTGSKKHRVTRVQRNQPNQILPTGLAVYGPVRLLTLANLSDAFQIKDDEWLHKGLTYGLFNPVGILKDLTGGYVFNVRPKEYQDVMHSVIENLEEIIPNIQKIEIPEGPGMKLRYFQKSFAYDPSHQGVDFEALPSGTKNIAALILDLLITFNRQQPKISDLNNYNGIVLIDEIDLHLHPKMQREIVKQLYETFPNVQFIVTTHSPIPMLGAPENSTFISVSRNEHNEICARNLDIDITNLLPNAILTSPIFGFETLINEHFDKSERLVTEDEYTDALFYKMLAKKVEEESNKLRP